MRAPLVPSGWPSAILPSFGFGRFRVTVAIFPLSTAQSTVSYAVRYFPVKVAGRLARKACMPST